MFSISVLLLVSWYGTHSSEMLVLVTTLACKSETGPGMLSVPVIECIYVVKANLWK